MTLEIGTTPTTLGTQQFQCEFCGKESRAWKTVGGKRPRGWMNLEGYDDGVERHVCPPCARRSLRLGEQFIDRAVKRMLEARGRTSS